MNPGTTKTLTYYEVEERMGDGRWQALLGKDVDQPYESLKFQSLADATEYIRDMAKIGYKTTSFRPVKVTETITREWLPEGDTPAAACPQCGGWSASGGMSHVRNTNVPVLGRIGCTCHR